MSICRPSAIGAAFVMILILISGCADPASSQSTKPEPPAKLTGTAVKEDQLTTITLSADAEARLGLQVKETISANSSQIRRFSGEVTAPLGSSLIVSSSIAGTLQSAESGLPSIGSSVRKGQPLFQLTPLMPPGRDERVTVQAEVAQARTRVEAARLRKERADRMLADQVGTVRVQEDAQQELALATIALQAAESRLRQIETSPLELDVRMVVQAPRDGMLRQIFAAPGQTVNAGAQLFEVVDLTDVWVRVPVYAGEVSSLAATARASVQALNGTGPTWTAQPVTTPPSADPASSTVDIYYRLSNQSLRFKPGEKLMVTIPARGSQNWLQVPWSAVVFDTRGGAWIYESVGDRRYERRRVELDHVTSGTAYLNGGVAPGTKVVVEGTAELWGFEFGTGK